MSLKDTLNACTAAATAAAAACLSCITGCQSRAENAADLCAAATAGCKAAFAAYTETTAALTAVRDAALSPEEAAACKAAEAAVAEAGTAASECAGACRTVLLDDTASDALAAACARCSIACEQARGVAAETRWTCYYAQPEAQQLRDAVHADERRDLSLFNAPRELREVRIGTDRKLHGYAAVYNAVSDPIRTGKGVEFREVLRPGCFDESLKDGHNILALVSHDTSKILGSTRNRTLRLQVDDKGLRFELDPADTSYSRDVQALVDRGEIRGCSFSFSVRPGGQAISKTNGMALRELTKLDVGEISLTGIPAYEATTVEIRDATAARQIEAAAAGSPKEAKRKLLNLLDLG